MLLEKQIDQVHGILQQAGQKLKEYFSDPSHRVPQSKSDGSPVTLADQKISDFLVKELSVFGFPVVSEEGERQENISGGYFLVDPLDGTKYFSRGDEDFCILVGFVEDDQPTFGAIQVPLSGDYFYGVKGQGAFVNGRPLEKWQASGSRVAVMSGLDKKSKSGFKISLISMRLSFVVRLLSFARSQREEPSSTRGWGRPASGILPLAKFCSKRSVVIWSIFVTVCR